MAAGLVNRHELRTRYRMLFPGVYLHHSEPESLLHRTVAAWLWSRRRSVVAGLAAAALHGSRWVDDTVDIELLCGNARPPAGVRTRQNALADGEFEVVSGIPVTTTPRTVFDLGRRGPLEPAVARVDALLHATKLQPSDIEHVAARHPHVRGLRQLEVVLALADPAAESLWETWLRLLLRRSGLPPVDTQIEIFDDDGRFVARLDMGWRDVLVAVEFDGDEHRTKRRQYKRDLRRHEEVARLNWVAVRVVAGDSEADIFCRVRAAVVYQLSRLNLGIDFETWAANQANWRT